MGCLTCTRFKIQSSHGGGGGDWMQGQQTFTAVAHVVFFLFSTAATLRVQDECDPLLQLLFAAVDFDEYTAGLMLATHFIFLSAQAGISAVYVSRLVFKTAGAGW